MENKILILLFSILLFSSCEKKPEYVYKVNQTTKVCKLFKITNYDPINFEYEKIIPFDQCPEIFGIQTEFVESTTNAIRDGQKQLKECD